MARLSHVTFAPKRMTTRDEDVCSGLGNSAELRGHLSFTPKLHYLPFKPSTTLIATCRPIGHLLLTSPFPIYQLRASFTMRFFSSLLSLALLVTGAIAAKKSPAERFNQYHAKAQSSSPLKLNEVSYKSLTAAPRDYTVAVLLTALDARFGCSLCREFQPEWSLLSKSWAKGDKSGESRMLYGTLDFSDGRDIFMSVCNMATGIYWM
jgi:hypothetical protein